MSEKKPQPRSAAPSSDNQVRLNKFISDTGYCSRREADKLIEQGRVLINGQPPEMGMKVGPEDEVLVDDKPLRRKEQPIYIALNKPSGITCTTERHVEGNIVDFIGHRKRIFPIGRLDKASDGLIFMTNDGDIVNKILRAGNSHEKEYVVRVNKPVTEEFLSKMASGVPILDTVTLPCKVTQETTYSFRIVLTQGLNRQIRRMCEALDYEVYKLRRVRIMNITIDGLPNGKWRYLTEAEMADIHRLLAQSSKTEEASRMSGAGKAMKKATDAKLYDARQQEKKEGESVKFKTYQGKGEVDRRRSGSKPSKHPRAQSGAGQRAQGQKPGGKPGQGQRRGRPDTSGTASAPTGIKKWKSKKEQD
ncbi:23S rRNA pseudouridine(2604) synthase RluF [Photobacterium sp. 1_MG-2023]|uniref:23S rRNA pseudouridine(2604) synthase RluF n=1 Tax=Photobacterium sp. 1_MG-2023 TaxID=3062646 RepID=UPI0026E11726|nr:23S rRNA pseudouridine(2604) synthase RluF [Photobacterium sp. 1_MG-2023]MDO6707184.1 23S rRNA pseudouridine(2604) synthase RluF [Photobacterium sp. 1_MG-2023]